MRLRLVMLGGGGSGGRYNTGAGGGAGGLIDTNITLECSSLHEVIIGTGGINTTGTYGSNGSDTEAFGLSAYGGGGGGGGGTAGSGGSGIVLIRYVSTVPLASGDIITASDGYTGHAILESTNFRIH